MKSEFYVFIEYLIRYFSTGDETYRNLYIGEKLKQLYDSDLTPEEDDANRARVTEGDIRFFAGIGQGRLVRQRRYWNRSCARWRRS